MIYFKLITILIKVRLREPLEFIWNIVVPIIIFIVFILRGVPQTINEQIFLSYVSPFLSWIICQSSIYGVGMYLLSWRESSFLKSLVHTNTQKYNLILSVVFIQIFYSVLYTLLILASSYLLLNHPPSFTHTLLIFSSITFTLIYSFASLALNSLSLSYQSISTILSILILPLAWLSGDYKENSLSGNLNYFNPMFYFNQFNKYLFNNPSPDSSLGVYSFIFIVICIYLSFIGITKFKVVSKIER